MVVAQFCILRCSLLSCSTPPFRVVPTCASFMNHLHCCLLGIRLDAFSGYNSPVPPGSLSAILDLLLFCTGVHSFPQRNFQKPLAKKNDQSYLRFQIGPGSLKNFAAQLNEGAMAARRLRPQCFCPEVGFSFNSSRSGAPYGVRLKKSGGASPRPYGICQENGRGPLASPVLLLESKFRKPAARQGNLALRRLSGAFGFGAIAAAASSHFSEYHAKNPGGETRQHD